MVSEKEKTLFVIGIGGVSNGGKTTLCNSLTGRLNLAGVRVDKIHQDDYFKEEKDVPWHESGKFRKWDDLVAIDCDKMMDAVRSKVAQMQNDNSPAVLIIEGFLIFNVRELNAVFRKRFFLTLSEDVARKRRLNRVYEPPDTDTIFMDHVWPMYISYFEHLRRDGAEIVELDGTTHPNSILETVVTEMRQILPNSPL